MARKLNLTMKANPFARVKDRRINGTTHETRKVGYKTKYRHCKNPACQKLTKFARSDQIYCNEKCRAAAKLAKRKHRDKTFYYAKLNHRPAGTIEYRKCESPDCHRTFPARTNNAKYCSVRCYDIARKSKMRETYRKLNPLPEPPAKPIAPHTADECITAGYTGDV